MKPVNIDPAAWEMLLELQQRHEYYLMSVNEAAATAIRFAHHFKETFAGWLNKINEIQEPPY